MRTMQERQSYQAHLSLRTKTILFLKKRAIHNNSIFELKTADFVICPTVSFPWKYAVSLPFTILSRAYVRNIERSRCISSPFLKLKPEVIQ